MNLRIPSWQSLLSYRLAVPIAVALMVLVVGINEFSADAAASVAQRRDAAVEARLAVIRARRTVLLMESAQRGYLLSGRSEYRAPFDEAQAQVDDVIRSLRELAAKWPVQRVAVQQLIKAIERKVSELSEVIRLFESGARERAVELMLTDIGREQMERLNAVVEQVISGEDAAYERGTSQGTRVRLWSRVALYSLLLLCLGGVVAARRMVRERERERASHLVELSAERDQLEDKVVRRTRELTELARHLQTVREDERSRLARELHDELGGLLTAAKLDVARVRKRLPGAAAEVTERIDHLAQTLDAGIALKRRIIEDLRPSSLANLGLQRTLQIQCSEFAKQADLKVQASIAELELNDERELAIYRIVQEALTNVAKYAAARNVWVSLERVGDQVRVQVRDDGIGFDTSQLRVGAHGLSGMRFRVQSCGGELQLRSAPGQGTLVQADIPMDDGADDEPAAPAAPT